MILSMRSFVHWTPRSKLRICWGVVRDSLLIGRNTFRSRRTVRCLKQLFLLERRSSKRPGPQPLEVRALVPQERVSTLRVAPVGVRADVLPQRAGAVHAEEVEHLAAAGRSDQPRNARSGRTVRAPGACGPPRSARGTPVFDQPQDRRPRGHLDRGQRHSRGMPEQHDGHAANATSSPTIDGRSSRRHGAPPHLQSRDDRERGGVDAPLSTSW